MKKIQASLRPKNIQFTPEGYQKLIKDLNDFQTKRKTAIVNLQTAREMGDLSENGAYKAARFELTTIDRQIRKLTYLIRFGVVSSESKIDVVTFGSHILLQGDKNTLEFELVGGYESDPTQHKFSVHSPIGKAVIGKKVGDDVFVYAPEGVKKYKISKVG